MGRHKTVDKPVSGVFIKLLGKRSMQAIFLERAAEWEFEGKVTPVSHRRRS